MSRSSSSPTEYRIVNPTLKKYSGQVHWQVSKSTLLPSLAESQKTSSGTGLRRLFSTEQRLPCPFSPSSAGFGTISRVVDTALQDRLGCPSADLDRFFGRVPTNVSQHDHRLNAHA